MNDYVLHVLVNESGNKKKPWRKKRIGSVIAIYQPWEIKEPCNSPRGAFFTVTNWPDHLPKQRLYSMFKETMFRDEETEGAFVWRIELERDAKLYNELVTQREATRPFRQIRSLIVHQQQKMLID